MPPQEVANADAQINRGQNPAQLGARLQAAMLREIRRQPGQDEGDYT
jgi:hypothetical protein